MRWASKRERRQCSEQGEEEREMHALSKRERKAQVEERRGQRRVDLPKQGNNKYFLESKQGWRGGYTERGKREDSFPLKNADAATLPHHKQFNHAKTRRDVTVE